MHTPPKTHTLDASLLLVPGGVLALFIVHLGRAGAVLAVPRARFLEGLKAACDLLGFAELQRFDDAPLDELLPWAGNV